MLDTPQCLKLGDIHDGIYFSQTNVPYDWLPNPICIIRVSWFVPERTTKPKCIRIFRTPMVSVVHKPVCQTVRSYWLGTRVFFSVCSSPGSTEDCRIPYVPASLLWMFVLLSLCSVACRYAYCRTFYSTHSFTFLPLTFHTTLLVMISWLNLNER